MLQQLYRHHQAQLLNKLTPRGVYLSVSICALLICSQITHGTPLGKKHSGRIRTVCDSRIWLSSEVSLGSR